MLRALALGRRRGGTIQSKAKGLILASIGGEKRRNHVMPVGSKSRDEVSSRVTTHVHRNTMWMPTRKQRAFPSPVFSFIDPLVLTNQSPEEKNCDPFFQQVRWKRHVGNKSFDKPRPPTKKQRKAHNRKLKAEREARERHGAPGSRASIRREWAASVKQDLLRDDEEDSQIAAETEAWLNEYDMGDALLDDLMGNTAHLGSEPTPRPVYLGHRHRQFYNRVADKMHEHHRQREALARRQLESVDKKSELGLPVVPLEERPASLDSVLPTDDDISLVIRSYRDRTGTRQKPVGLVRALRHLLQDLHLPVDLFGEKTYTALMTCCRTAAEGRRVLQLQRQRSHPVSAYSWSVLVDVHAKVGDYRGCRAVMQEMLADGTAPTLAAYTSLLAGCYKVCNDGRVAHGIRADAAKTGEEAWHEMRTVGIEADAMAYGAMLRLCASRGHAERALNLLEEMQQAEVKPTTLCFTSALRAVARSHATAVRFERGATRTNRRREMITKHHGKLARSIVIQAEEAEVEQDDGFVAALIMCAAESGDAATAKSVYVATQIRRKCHHLRTIGSREHLARLRGEDSESPEERPKRRESLSAQDDESDVITESSSRTTPQSPVVADGYGPEEEPSPWDLRGNVAVASGQLQRAHKHMQSQRQRNRSHPTFEEREYGRDSRILSAVVHACAVAAGQSGIGTMWQGRENLGYLCENSLRLISARWQPRYTDNSIPGQTRTDALTWDGEQKMDNYREGKRQSRKFSGVYEDEDAGTSLDDVDGDIARMFLDDDGRLKEEYRPTKPEDIWRIKYGKDDEFLNINDHDEREEEVELLEGGREKLDQPAVAVDEERIDLRGGDTNDESESIPFANTVAPTPAVATATSSEEMYFDYNTMRWNTGFRKQTTSQQPHSLGEPETIPSEPDERSSAADIQEKEEKEEEEKEMYFDKDAMRWKTRPRTRARTTSTSGERHAAEREDSMLASPVEETEQRPTQELYFDATEMRWKTRDSPMTTGEVSLPEDQLSRDTDFKTKVIFEGKQGAVSSKDDGGTEVDEAEFSKFFSDLKEEVIESGGDDVAGGVTEEEARELFLMMKEEYNEMMAMDLGDAGLREPDLVDPDSEPRKDDVVTKGGHQSGSAGAHDESQGALRSDRAASALFQEMEGETARQAISETLDAGPIDVSGRYSTIKEVDANGVSNFDAGTVASPLSARTARVASVRTLSAGEAFFERDVMDGAFTETVEILDKDSDSGVIDYQLEELRRLLPAFSDRRLRRIQRSYQKTLGDPSLLDLVPIVRERMPDYITQTWLRKWGALTARYVLREAAKDRLVDVHMLNSALEMETFAGLNRALQFYDTEFRKNGLRPTCYSNRLVLQMLLRNRQWQRAMKFKERVEHRGQTLDIHSYASLIEFCARHGQLGSSLLLLKECLAVHEAPPGEAFLSKLRLLCRQTGVDEKIGLKALIGEDPLEWLRHGKAVLKRERSKRGRRNVHFAQNVMLQV